jgi:hypothetical protein
LTDTRHKLDEASYFLEKLKGSIEDDRIFSFNLSAFVTASRSVTLIMQKDFQHDPTFCDWHAGKLRSIESDNDFKFFNQLRVATVHTHTLRPNKKVGVSIVEPAVPVSDSVSVRVIQGGKEVEERTAQHEERNTQSVSSSGAKAYEPFRLLGKRISKNKGSKSVSRFFQDRPGEDLVGLCEEHLGKLNKLVDECERFSDR